MIIIVAIAIWEDVDVIVSGDKDLLALREYLDRPRTCCRPTLLLSSGIPTGSRRSRAESTRWLR